MKLLLWVFRAVGCLEPLLFFSRDWRKDLGLALLITRLSGHEPPETRGEAIVSGPAAARWKLNINLNILNPTGIGGGGVSGLMQGSHV